MTKTHLWQIEHPYYCNDTNYFSNDSTSEFESFQDFLEEINDECLDMNLIFRWDWTRYDPDDVDDFDTFYTGDILSLYYMAQRKGAFYSVQIKVCEADEENIIKFLKPRWNKIKELWEGI